MTCFCDRYWWLIHACRMPGAESMPLPIECPLDHIYDMGRWCGCRCIFCQGRGTLVLALWLRRVQGRDVRSGF